MLQSNFTSGEESSGRNGLYRSELGLSSTVWILESNCGAQYTQGGGMVPGKTEDHNSYRGELGG